MGNIRNLTVSTGQIIPFPPPHVSAHADKRRPQNQKYDLAGHIFGVTVKDQLVRFFNDTERA